jgi:exodeoxyribonuclease III
MKLATWNVNSLTVRLPQVLDWLQANPVDVLALQELKMTDDKFPHAAFAQAGYSAECFGQKTYNGVALLSRTPATDVMKNIPGFDDDMARVISATFPLEHEPVDHSVNNSELPFKYKGLRVIGAYFPNGQEPGSDKFEYKMAWLDGLRAWLRKELLIYPNLVLMGDFNITFDDADVWDPEGMRDQIHCTDEERYHLQALIALGLTDALRLFPQPAKCYSWWDYRDMAFRRNRGLRIDHILISSSLRPAVRSCLIDKAPRKNERPSDHAPVVLELAAKAD